MLAGAPAGPAGGGEAVTMSAPYRVIDADSHVFESRSLWLDRLPEPFSARAPRFQTSPGGQELFLIDGKWQKGVSFGEAPGGRREQLAPDPFPSSSPTLLVSLLPTRS
jgi:hypothetical protein